MQSRSRIIRSSLVRNTPWGGLRLKRSDSGLQELYLVEACGPYRPPAFELPGSVLEHS